MSEVMDKVFGGGERRGLMQGLALLIVGIVFLILAGVMPFILAAMAAMAIIAGDLIGAASIALAILWMPNLFYVLGAILLILGIIGIIWYLYRR